MPPPAKIGALRGQTGARGALTRADSADAAHALVCSCDHLIKIGLLRNVPWAQGKRTHPTAGRVPDGVHVCSSWGCTPSRAGTGLVEGFGPCKARAVGALHFGPVGKQAIITPACPGVDWGKRLPEPVRKPGTGRLRPTWMPGFRRDVHRRVPWRDRGRPWGPRRLGLLWFTRNGHLNKGDTIGKGGVR